VRSWCEVFVTKFLIVNNVVDLEIIQVATSLIVKVSFRAPALVPGGKFNS